ncbi:MAG: M16 family metallopeptidase, partial [Gemmatimonadales bacterium]
AASGVAVPFDDAMLQRAWQMPSRAQDPVMQPAQRPVARVGRSGGLRDVHGTVHHLAIDDCDILTAQFGDTGQTAVGFYRRRTDIEDSATAGLAALAVRAMMRGTERLPGAALAFAIESLGGALRPTLSPDLIGFGTVTLTARAADAAALIDEVLRRPRFDPDDVAIERLLLMADARSIADDMMRFPMQLAFAAAFGDTGYGSPLLGTEAAIATFDAERVGDTHRALLAGGRTTIVAVGDGDPVQLAEAIAGAVQTAGEPGGAGLPAPRVMPVRPGSRIAYRDREQAAMAMLFPGPSRTSPDRFAAETWGAIAAGLGGRLFESLRSARSLAYTVIADSWQRRRAGGLLTYIATDPARLGEARDAMLEELDRFRREPPAGDEVRRATAMLAGEVEMARQTAGAFAAEIADAWLLGDGVGELLDPAAPYRAVNAADVYRVVSNALDPAARAEGVVTTSPPE